MGIFNTYFILYLIVTTLQTITNENSVDENADDHTERFRVLDAEGDLTLPTLPTLPFRLYPSDFTLPATTNESMVFQIMFGILVIVTLLLFIRYNFSYDIKSTKIFYVGSLFFGIAFLLWNIDTRLCENITDLRQKILEHHSSLQYLSPFTQFHGWWHLLSGYAVYLYVLNIIQHRLEFQGIQYFVVTTPLGWSVQVERGSVDCNTYYRQEKNVENNSFA